MAQPAVIRPARAEDAQGVAGCVRAAYAHYVERIGKPPGPMRDDYRAVISDHDVHVIAHEDCIVGVVVLQFAGGRVLLDNIAVHPQAQGRGLGQALLAFAERRADARGFADLDLYTHALMDENIAWYRRHGYRETTRVTEKGFHRVYMRKALRRS